MLSMFISRSHYLTINNRFKQNLYKNKIKEKKKRNYFGVTFLTIPTATV